MTRAVFLAFIYLGLRSELEGNVVWNLTEEQGETGITWKRGLAVWE